MKKRLNSLLSSIKLGLNQLEEKYLFVYGKRTWQILSLLAISCLVVAISIYAYNSIPTWREDVSISKMEFQKNEIDLDFDDILHPLHLHGAIISTFSLTAYFRILSAGLPTVMISFIRSLGKSILSSIVSSLVIRSFSISSMALKRKRFCGWVYISQNVQLFQLHPMVTCRIRLCASEGGRNTGST